VLSKINCSVLGLHTLEDEGTTAFRNVGVYRPESCYPLSYVKPDIFLGTFLSPLPPNKPLQFPQQLQYITLQQSHNNSRHNAACIVISSPLTTPKPLPKASFYDSQTSASFLYRASYITSSGVYCCRPLWSQTNSTWALPSGILQH